MNIKFTRFLKSWSVAFLMLAGCLAISGCDGGKAADKTTEQVDMEEPMIYDITPFSGDAAAIAEGKKIFDLKCGQCHGPDAGGGPEAPDLTDQETIYGPSDGDMFRIVFYGTDNGMPTWGAELMADRIWKVIAYIGSLK